MVSFVIVDCHKYLSMELINDTNLFTLKVLRLLWVEFRPPRSSMFYCKWGNELAYETSWIWDELTCPPL